MIKRKQEEQVSRLIKLARGLKRYRLAILCGKPSSGKSQIAMATADRLQARHINLTDVLLPQIAQPDFFPTLGAYGPEDLTDWILEEAYKPDASFLIIDQIEPLLATFGRAKATQFFQMVSQIEPKTTIILVTFLARQVEQSAFPKERLLLV